MFERQERAYSSAKGPGQRCSGPSQIKEGVMVSELPAEADLADLFTNDPPEVTAFLCFDES
jgi:hypothetical protein